MHCIRFTSFLFKNKSKLITKVRKFTQTKTQIFLNQMSLKTKVQNLSFYYVENVDRTNLFVL